jgi:hypothetical protein
VFAPGLLLLLLSADLPSAEAPPVEVWVGHQILRGTRRVPLKGPVPTEAQNFMLAKVRRNGTHWEIQQQFCRSENKPVKNVTVAASPTAIARMKVSPVTVDVSADGTATVSPWNVVWGRDDLDGDGHPGVSFTVDGTFCSGDLYVASQSYYTATKARVSGNELTGEMKIDQRQQVLGASGFCLRAMVGDSTDSQVGSFAYKAMPAGTTCASLAGKPWPVQATPPAVPAAAK